MLNPVQYRSDAPGSLTNIQRTLLEHEPPALLQRLHDLVRHELGSPGGSADDRAGRGERRGQRRRVPRAGRGRARRRHPGRLGHLHRRHGRGVAVARPHAGQRGLDRCGRAPCRASRPGRCEFVVQAVERRRPRQPRRQPGRLLPAGSDPRRPPGARLAHADLARAVSAPASGTYGGTVLAQRHADREAPTPLRARRCGSRSGGSEIDRGHERERRRRPCPCRCSPRRGSYDVTAAFDGTTTLAASSAASQPFTVTKLRDEPRLERRARSPRRSADDTGVDGDADDERRASASPITASSSC